MLIYVFLRIYVLLKSKRETRARVDKKDNIQRLFPFSVFLS